MRENTTQANANEQEQSAALLHRLAKAMAAVKDGRELLKIIVEETQPVFGFYDIGLVVKDKSGNFYIDWSVFYEEISPRAANVALRAARNYEFAADDKLVKHVLDRAANEKKPFIENMTAQLVEEFSDFSQLPIEVAHGYKQFLVSSLKFGGETFGFLTFNSVRGNHFESSDFELFQAIADLVAVAVANIRANEEIIERAGEKSVLLSISEVIATVRSKKDLLQLIIEKIKPVFNFYDCGIFVFDRDRRTLEDLAVSFPDISPSDSNNLLAEIGAAKFQYEDSVWEQVFETMRAARAPVIINYKNNEIFGWSDYVQAAVIEQIGYEESLMTILYSGGEELGVFAVNSLEKGTFNEHQFSLFQNIANQMAVAVSNILANEEIQKQLAEITDLKKRLEAENVYLTEEIGKNYNFEEIIGTSSRLRQVFEIIETVAPTDATVLIQGETGTGKELAARAVHNRSTRSARPLIKINCAVLPRELIESELFGHERGSFTGAHERRIGKFELADKGTIFLDEIGELPLDAQVKLLRVLQEKEIERIGGKGTIKLDLRVVAATNRNLAAEVQAGRFRADLYYRISTVELFVPALRERPEDIEPLTMYFARQYAAKFSRRIERVSTEMLRELKAYDFPGNVRELEHIVEHAVIFSKNEKLFLPRPLAEKVETNQVSDGNESAQLESSEGETQTLSSIERQHIIEVLRQTSGRIKGKGGAAEILALNPATVYFRMKKLGIERKNDEETRY